MADMSSSGTVGGFRRRVEQLRQAMRENQLDALVIYKAWGERYNGTGYARFIIPWITIPHQPGFVTVPLEGDVVWVQVGGLGAEHLEATTPGLRIVAASEMTQPRMTFAQIVPFVAAVLQEANATAGNVGLCVYAELPLWAYEELKKLLPKGSFVDATPLLDRLMMIKSADEIEFVRRAAELADTGFETVFSTIRVGIREYDVTAEAQYRLIKHGASYADVRVATGKPSDPRGGVRPSSEKLVEPDDHVHVAIDLTYKDYWVNVVKRGVVGRASKDHMTLFDVVLAAREALLAEIRPGNPASRAFRATRQVVESARAEGLFERYVLQRLGHGTGLEKEERPFIIEAEDIDFQTNMTLSLHPGFLVPGLAQVADGAVVLVTDRGSKPFTTFPSRLMEV